MSFGVRESDGPRALGPYWRKARKCLSRRSGRADARPCAVPGLFGPDHAPTLPGNRLPLIGSPVSPVYLEAEYLE